MPNSRRIAPTRNYALDLRFPIVVAVTTLGTLAATLTSIAFAIGSAA